MKSEGAKKMDTLATLDHDLNPYDRHLLCAPIHIGNRVWIGAGAIIKKIDNVKPIEKK